MGVVPIFELIRRNNPNLKLAAVSGKLVIIPNESASNISAIAKKEKVSIKIISVKNTEHSEVRFESAKSSQKISIITKAFNSGVINAIVGTKSLLGEGWDSPVINTIILASFVGSFVLSNQMRGRAIRIDREHPDKVSNIWHLTTIVPKYFDYENKFDKFIKKTFNTSDKQDDNPLSADYEILMRRFLTFVGLNYTEDVIENGIERASFLKPPYDESCVNNANEKTFALAKNRDTLYRRWNSALEKATDEIVIEKEQKQPVLHSKFVYFNALAILMLTAFNAILFSQIYRILIDLQTAGIFIALVFIAGISVIYTILIKKLVLLLTPYKMFKKIVELANIKAEEITQEAQSSLQDISNAVSKAETHFDETVKQIHTAKTERDKIVADRNAEADYSKALADAKNGEIAHGKKDLQKQVITLVTENKRLEQENLRLMKDNKDLFERHKGFETSSDKYSKAINAISLFRSSEPEAFARVFYKATSILQPFVPMGEPVANVKPNRLRQIEEEIRKEKRQEVTATKETNYK